MKHIYSVLFFLTISFALKAQDCGERYQTYISSGINQFKDIQYGFNYDNKNIPIDLKMDIYTPKDDSSVLRPLIIFVHGGSFIGGDKGSEAQAPIARDMARKGYVTASINYRLQRTVVPEIDPILEFADKENWYKAITRGMHDIKAAIRFMKREVAENGNPYGIDTNNITLYGSSAGAISVLHAVYLTDINDAIPVFKSAIEQLGGIEGNSGNPGYASTNTVRAVVSCSGAMTERRWIGNRPDVDLIAFHHNTDPTVPFGYGCFVTAACHLGRFYGSNPLTQEAKLLNIRNELHFFDEIGHPADNFNPEYVNSKMTSFLYETQCNYLNSQATPVINRSSFALKAYPNPADNFVRISWPMEGQVSVSMNDITGRQVWNGFSIDGFIEISVNNLPAGMYVLRAESADQTAVGRIIVQ